jgi:CRP/FNR family cyclic AMP-dependent transcriptional regulator
VASGGRARLNEVNAARIELLQGMPIFGALREDALECLLAGAAAVVRNAGEAYFREGERSAPSVYVVERGGVRVQKRWQGGEWVLKELGVGDCFGEMSLLDLEPRSASVCATVDDTCAMQFGADALHRLFSHDPEQFALLQMNIAREVCRRLRVADEMLLGVRVGESRADTGWRRLGP